MSELFSIQLQNRQQQGRDGVWLDLPTTTEQVQAALRQIGISSDNPQGLFISGYFAEEKKRFAIPYNMVLASNVDELNFLASRLETLSAGERAELNAALQVPQSELSSIGRITDFPENVDYYVHLPDVRGPAQLGDYYLNRSGMVDMPEEWKGGIDTAQFGRYVTQQEQGAFTQYGYLVKSGDEWQKVYEGQPVPEEYRVLSFPASEILRDAANIPPPVQSTTEQQKLADFDQSLQDYKAQVQAEIAQEAAAAGMTVEEYAAAGFEAPQQDSFSIYQLRNEDSTRDYRFEPYDRLQATGLTVDKANYTEVYAAPLTAGTTLEDIYRTFNVDHPADFKGHSLSVSDVVVLHQNGHDTAHYCDSVGFQQVPEFLQENPLRTAELSTEQNENMIDGVLNNAPSLGELEAKAKAGEQISLTDLAAAVKAEEKAPKAKKSRAAKPKKPSIRAQLDAAKKEQSQQTQPREKSKELEV